MQKSFEINNGSNKAADARLSVSRFVFPSRRNYKSDGFDGLCFVAGFFFVIVVFDGTRVPDGSDAD
jgi:hypothetical protein